MPVTVAALSALTRFVVALQLLRVAETHAGAQTSLLALLSPASASSSGGSGSGDSKQADSQATNVDLLSRLVALHLPPAGSDGKDDGKGAAASTATATSTLLATFTLIILNTPDWCCVHGCQALAASRCSCARTCGCRLRCVRRCCPRQQPVRPLRAPLRLLVWHLPSMHLRVLTLS